jgi:cation diffusion facilitator CzcD-associated flavoprotein CzcO
MTQPHIYEIAIIGAGPIGLELAVCLKRAGVDYIHLDAGQIGHTLTWWPRNTSFFSTTERPPSAWRSPACRSRTITSSASPARSIWRTCAPWSSSSICRSIASSR